MPNPNIPSGNGDTSSGDINTEWDKTFGHSENESNKSEKKYSREEAERVIWGANKLEDLGALVKELDKQEELADDKELNELINRRKFALKYRNLVVFNMPHNRSVESLLEEKKNFEKQISEGMYKGDLRDDEIEDVRNRYDYWEEIIRKKVNAENNDGDPANVDPEEVFQRRLETEEGKALLKELNRKKEQKKAEYEKHIRFVDRVFEADEERNKEARVEAENLYIRSVEKLEDELKTAVMSGEMEKLTEKWKGESDKNEEFEKSEFGKELRQAEEEYATKARDCVFNIRQIEEHNPSRGDIKESYIRAWNGLYEKMKAQRVGIMGRFNDSLPTASAAADNGDSGGVVNSPENGTAGQVAAVVVEYNNSSSNSGDSGNVGSSSENGAVGQVATVVENDNPLTANDDSAVNNPPTVATVSSSPEASSKDNNELGKNGENEENNNDDDPVKGFSEYLKLNDEARKKTPEFVESMEEEEIISSLEDLVKQGADINIIAGKISPVNLTMNLDKFLSLKADIDRDELARKIPPEEYTKEIVDILLEHRANPNIVNKKLSDDLRNECFPKLMYYGANINIAKSVDGGIVDSIISELGGDTEKIEKGVLDLLGFEQSADASVLAMNVENGREFSDPKKYIEGLEFEKKKPLGDYLKMLEDNYPDGVITDEHRKMLREKYNEATLSDEELADLKDVRGYLESMALFDSGLTGEERARLPVGIKEEFLQKCKSEKMSFRRALKDIDFEGVPLAFAQRGTHDYIYELFGGKIGLNENKTEKVYLAPELDKVKKNKMAEMIAERKKMVKNRYDELGLDEYGNPVDKRRRGMKEWLKANKLKIQYGGKE